MLTKTDLKNIEKLFEEKFDEKFDGVRAELLDDIARFKDEIISEFHPLQEEQIVCGGAIARHNDEIEDLDIRVSILEDKGLPN